MIRGPLALVVMLGCAIGFLYLRAFGRDLSDIKSMISLGTILAISVVMTAGSMLIARIRGD